jgi:polysaccharide biosynthesis protein PslF
MSGAGGPPPSPKAGGEAPPPPPPNPGGSPDEGLAGARYSVLFLAGEYPPRPGGVGDYTALLAAHLAEQGVRVTVLASRAQGRPTRDPQSRAPHLQVWRAVGRWDWRCARTVLAAVQAARPDVVHVQYQPAAFGMEGAVHWLPGWLRRRCPGVRTATTFHDLRLPYLFPKAGRWRAAVRDRLLRGSDAAIYTERADWATAAAVRPAGRYWVPIGSNIAPAPPAGYDREQWRQAVGADPATFLIAHLGILNRSKGLETLFAALLRLHEQGRRVRLLLIGAEAGASDPSNRAYAAEIDRRLADPALAALVHRLPLLPAEKASGYLLAADAAAFPFTDGASLRRGSLLAALAHGLPTVSTGRASPRPPSGENLSSGLAQSPDSAMGITASVAPPIPSSPRLRAGENLLLVPPHDPEALATALGRVAEDMALRGRLSDGGRALVDALSWPRIAAAHRAIYAAVLAGS